MLVQCISRSMYQLTHVKQNAEQDELNSNRITQQKIKTFLYIYPLLLLFIIISGRPIIIVREYCGLLLKCLAKGSLRNRANKTTSLCFHHDFFSFCFRLILLFGAGGCFPRLQPSATLSDHNYWSMTKGCASDAVASASVRLIQCEQQYRSAVSAVAWSLCVLINPARTTAQLFVYEGLVSCRILLRSCSWLMPEWFLDHETAHPLLEYEWRNYI